MSYRPFTQSTMKQSINTFNILLAISLDLLEVVIEIIETGQLMARCSEYKWTYQRFKGFDRRKIHKTLNNLSRQKFVERVEDKYFLTKRGKLKFLELDLYFSLKLPTHQIWTGVWYLVVFDIPEKCRNDRKKLQKILCKSGLIKLQKSVYIFPHNIEKEFVKIQNLFPKYQLILIQSTSPILKFLVYPGFKKSGIIK